MMLRGFLSENLKRIPNDGSVSEGKQQRVVVVTAFTVAKCSNVCSMISASSDTVVPQDHPQQHICSCC